MFSKFVGEKCLLNIEFSIKSHEVESL